jgi:hypothetical protein
MLEQPAQACLAVDETVSRIRGKDVVFFALIRALSVVLRNILFGDMDLATRNKRCFLMRVGMMGRFL